MHNWFECKVSFEKIMENGAQKKVTEPYLVDALSFPHHRRNPPLRIRGIYCNRHQTRPFVRIVLQRKWRPFL